MSPTVGSICARASRTYTLTSWRAFTTVSSQQARRTRGGSAGACGLRRRRSARAALRALLGSRFALAACPCRRQPGGTVERGDRPFQIVGDRIELGQRVVVAEQPEAEVAVVAHDGDAERLARGQRHDGVEALQLASEQVERELRARDVRDDEIEELLAGLQPRGLAEDRRRGEAGEVGEHL